MSQPLRAIFINCTLKYSPEPSNTEALMRKVMGYMQKKGIECTLIRLTDYNIKFGALKPDYGDGDEWPIVNQRINEHDIIIVGTPIWFGVRGSVAQMLIERLGSSSGDTDEETGQFPLYNKVAGVVVTGNEDGAHAAAETMLFNLTHLGCTVPPNCDCYWVGDAGPGPSYMDVDGEKTEYTDKTARYLVENVVFFAELLRDNPIPSNLKKLAEEAKEFANS